MKKVITIIGAVLIVLAILSLVLNSMGYITTIEVPSNKYGTDVKTGTSNPQLIISEFNTTKISGYQSVITAYIRINPDQNVQNQQFNITIGIEFSNSVAYGSNSYAANTYYPIGNSIQKTASGTNSFQINIATKERSSKIPILTSGFIMPDSNIGRSYYIQVSSLNSFTYSYKADAKQQIGLFIGVPLFIIGIIVVIAGVVLKDSGSPRKLKTRSWQEPTLGGVSSKSSYSRNSLKSSSSKKGSGGSAPKPRVSTAVNCKKCGGVMPRNSQYCPHCYTRQ